MVSIWHPQPAMVAEMELTFNVEHQEKPARLVFTAHTPLAASVDEPVVKAIRGVRLVAAEHRAPGMNSTTCPKHETNQRLDVPLVNNLHALPRHLDSKGRHKAISPVGHDVAGPCQRGC